MNRDPAPISGKMPSLWRRLFRVLALAAALSLVPVTGDAAFTKLNPVPGDLADPPRQSLEATRAALSVRLTSLKKQGDTFNAKCRSVEEGSSQEKACRSQLKELRSLQAAYNRDAERFNRAVGAAKDKVVASFLARTAATIEKEKIAVLTAPLASGSASPALLLSGRTLDMKAYEAHKKKVFRLLVEQTKLRDECRAGSAACSTDGKAFDEREANRRRDRQYFLWGEASYYIRFEDMLTDPPPEMAHEIGTLGGIKIWAMEGDEFYFFVKEVTGYGSTGRGGQGATKMGLRKAIKDNQGLNP